MASSSVKIGKKEPEIVVFKDPCKQKKNFHKQHSKKKNEKSTEKQKQIEDFRYGNLKREVSKLALSAYTGKEREQAMESYLIKLGAHPVKKKKPENYKLFLERKKNEKDEEKTKNTEKFRVSIKCLLLSFRLWPSWSTTYKNFNRMN
ncbi:Hypothetical predicted protein [Octopus vulgaris]|uniref:Uncharacterized protein n=1 Tax=Octopus vulgaris TaxID=6645 RepID=A0AA36EVV6_OCTVU|nr:Hypothetical predicted protein [Octopus vulgaris]